MITFHTLYKRDTKGGVRVWYMQLDGARHRTVSGLEGGAHVESGWTTCKPKSQPTAEEQAEFEVKAKYQHQLDRDYYDDRDAIDSGKFVQVMLAKPYTKWPGLCFSQPKLDGFRCRATAKGLFTRQNQRITAATHIEEALRPFFLQHPEAQLDGELYSHALKDEFEALSSALRKGEATEAVKQIQYWVYDLISEAERPFSERHAALTYWNDLIVPVPTEQVLNEDGLDRLEEQYLADGFEGQMVRLDKPYDFKRSSSLLKRKRFKDGEFKCLRIEEGNGNWAGYAKRIVCQLPDGREFGAGLKANQARARELLGETHHEVTVRYFRLTSDGIPYLPVAIAFHGDRRTL